MGSRGAQAPERSRRPERHGRSRLTEGRPGAGWIRVVPPAARTYMKEPRDHRLERARGQVAPIAAQTRPGRRQSANAKMTRSSPDEVSDHGRRGGDSPAAPHLQPAQADAAPRQPADDGA